MLPGVTIKFQLEYTQSKISQIDGTKLPGPGGVFPNTTVDNITFTVGATTIPAGSHVKVNFTPWTMSVTFPSNETVCRLGRVNSGATYNYNIYILNFGTHYPIAAPGTAYSTMS